MDDIARQARVAKATVYLHWKTREALFEALIKRERWTLAEELRGRLISDVDGMKPREMFKQVFLASSG